MSASFDSKQFFEDAAKFFADLQTSIDSQHNQHKESAKTEIDRLRRTFEARIEKTEDIVREQRRVIESLQSTQTQQTEAIQALTGQIQALTARIEALSTAAASMVPAPVVEPSQPKSQVQAPAADAEQEANAQDAHIPAKKAPKAKAPKSPDKEAPVAAIPESEPVTSPKATAVTTEVAAVETQEITTEQAPAVEPIVEAAAQADQQIPTAEDLNGKVLQQFLNSETVKEINVKMGKPDGMPRFKTFITKLERLPFYSNSSHFPEDVFEFALYTWLIAVLYTAQHGFTTKEFSKEFYEFFNTPNTLKTKKYKYHQSKEPAVISCKLSAMMSSKLRVAYMANPKNYLSSNKDLIRSITNTIVAHCENIDKVDKSHPWSVFLNNWLNQTNG